MGKCTPLQSEPGPSTPRVLDPASSTLQPSSPTSYDPKDVSPSSPPRPPKQDTIFYDAQDHLESGELDSSPMHTDQYVTCDLALEDAPNAVTGESVVVAPDPSWDETPGHLANAPCVPRGASAPAASPGTASIPYLARGIRCDFPLAVGSVSRAPVKKAVVVGINYASSGRCQPLQYGVKDATRFAGALRGRGFPEENTIVLTDEPTQEGQECPTQSNLVKWTHWLVHNAQAGDTLVFFFSGHAFNFGIFAGLIAADGMPFDRDSLHQHLVRPVPAGCELQIMLDCCFASAMIQLQYCIGRMVSPAELFSSEPSFVGHITVTASTTELVSPAFNAPASSNLSPAQPQAPLKHEAFSGSFNSLPTINGPGPPPVSTLPGSGPFAPSNNAPPPRRSRGNAVVAAAPPLPSASTNNVAGTETGRTIGEYLASWVGMGQAPSNSSTVPPRASTSGDPQRARQAVVEGTRLPDYFLERKERFIKPAGYVMFWAGTGENQRSFEAYPNSRFWNGTRFRVRNGIVANAICTVLDARINQKLTVRDLWNYLVGAIDEENGWRSERDAKKPERPDPKDRVQHAELWVSHAEPLVYAAPALDRPML